MKYFETLSEALLDLAQRGYTSNFNVQQDCLVCAEHDINLHPEDFHIDEVYRFEGNTDPADESILFAISSEKHGLKGVHVSAYGAYSDNVSSTLMAKLFKST